MKPTEVAAIRKALGLTQKELAHALNVHVQTVWRWEASRPPEGLPLEVLRALQNVVKVLPQETLHAVGRKLALGLGSVIYYGLII